MTKNSVLLRLALVIAVFIVLLIPLTMIQFLIDERQNYRTQAVSEVSHSWADTQLIGGPILSIITEEWRTNKENKSELVSNYFTFLPERLNIESEVFPEVRRRGIYEVSLYTTIVKISGSFNKQKLFGNLRTNPNRTIAKSTLLFNVSDLRGISDVVELNWNNNIMEVNPGMTDQSVFKNGFVANIKLDEQTETYSFTLNIKLKGSENLEFLPLGKYTSVQMKSSWNNPSFIGSFLPVSHKITNDGFEAKWNINHFNRDYPQEWINKNYNVMQSSFGLKLLMPVDEYQKTTRTSKYGVMIVLLTFISFFMIELYSKVVLHPIQYLLAGLAIIIFYSLLLSISEYLTFNFSYSITSLLVIGLVGLYVKSIYGKTKFGIIIGLLLTFFYGFMFVILQLQDYSLLLGNIALFIILAVIMYLTRKIDWYEIFSDNKKTM